jgi:1-acyl-sn-glycerol-3-phosphate acyltransferase
MWLMLLLLYPLTALLVKVRQRNIERIPPKGPVIVVTNHITHVDPAFAAKLVFDAGRRPRFMAKESLFETRIWGRAMKAMGHIPVVRDSTDANQALAAAAECLRHGGLIIMHPEGTVPRAPDGWPMQGKTGAARLACLVPEAPVIPIAQWGVQKQLNWYTHTLKFIPRPRHAISVGEPVDLSEFIGQKPTVQMLHQMTNVIMNRLRADVAELRGVPAPTGPLYRWHPVSDAKRKAIEERTEQ